MRVGVLGASGVIGRALVPLLRAAGIQIRAIVRDPTRSPLADEVIMADVLQPETLLTACAGLDAVVNLATSIPNSSGRGNWAENDRIRLHGTRHLVATLRTLNRPCRLVQQSVAMLHRGDAPTDEQGELVGEGVLASAIPMEAAVQASGLDWVLVRGAALYGNGTARDDAFFDRIAHGELRAPAEAGRWITFVHVDDLAAAFACATLLPEGGPYIAADECPLTYAQLWKALRGSAGDLPADAPTLPALPPFRVQARRLRVAGWRPKHPSLLAHLKGRDEMHECAKKAMTR